VGVAWRARGGPVDAPTRPTVGLGVFRIGLFVAPTGEDERRDG
jgi:hypothetical protein